MKLRRAFLVLLIFFISMSTIQSLFHPIMDEIPKFTQSIGSSPINYNVDSLDVVINNFTIKASDGLRELVEDSIYITAKQSGLNQSINQTLKEIGIGVAMAIGTIAITIVIILFGRKRA